MLSDVTAVRSSEPDANRAWACMLALFLGAAHQARLAGIAADLGLTPAGVKSLLWLPPGEGVAMRVLADDWGCDASNVTQLVDALEAAGYAERRGSPTDRRVKLVRLTRQGERARRKAIIRLHEPPEALLALSPADQSQLRRLLEKALERSGTPIELFVV